jgi:O-antigen/teichoic acid export membrane protein
VLKKFESVPAAVREGAVYALAIGLARATGVLLLPLLTDRLTDREFGVFGLLTSALLVVQYASGLGLDSGATRWFYEAGVRGLTGTELAMDQRRTLGTWVWMTLAVGVALSVGGGFFARPIARLAFDGTASEGRAVAAAAATIPALAMINVLQHWYRMVRRPIPALVVAGTVAAATLVLTVVFVAVRGAGVAGVFGAQAVVGAVVTVAGIVQMWPTIGRPRVDRERLREMLRYSVPLLPAVAAPLMLGLLTRVLIGAFSDVGQVGEFQVVSMIATVVVLFTMALQQAWEPFALSIVDRHAAKPLYRTALLGYSAVAGFMTCALAGLLPFVLPILGARFRDLALPAVVFAASMLIGGAIPIVNTGPSIAGTGRPALEAMIGGSVLNLALCAALVPKFGELGACWASLATAIVLVGLGVLRSERVWLIEFPMMKVLRVAGCSALATAGLLALSNHRATSFALRGAGVFLALLITAGATGWLLRRLTLDLRISKV